MKNYREYPTVELGWSDIGGVTAVGFSHDVDGYVASKFISFGGDGDYYAWLVDKDAEISSDCTLVFECSSWLRIYDDEGRKLSLYARKFKIFVFGEYGCLIQADGLEQR